jgi:hypothetical protein
VIRPRKRRDKEGPARKPEELHDGREDADHSRRGHDGQAVAGEHLSQEDGERCEQDGRDHEAEPKELETHAARLEAAQDDLGRAAQDVRVVEETRQQKEERVERDRQEDEEGAGGVFDVHRAASGSVSRNNTARRSQVSRPKTIAPLAPKIVNCSLMFLEITYEVTSHPSAQAGGFATAHQNAPEIRCRASTSACKTPTPTPVTAPMMTMSPRLIP